MLKSIENIKKLEADSEYIAVSQQINELFDKYKRKRSEMKKLNEEMKEVNEQTELLIETKSKIIEKYKEKNNPYLYDENNLLYWVKLLVELNKATKLYAGESKTRKVLLGLEDIVRGKIKEISKNTNE